jgi:hypothetical protein
MSLYVPRYRPYNKHKHKHSAPVRFEPTIPVSERPQTHALDRAATGLGRIRTPDRPIRSVVALSTTPQEAAGTALPELGTRSSTSQPRSTNFL